MIIRRIRAEDALPARDLRLLALKTDPLSFGSTWQREQAFADEVWIERAQKGAHSDDYATYFAADGDQLVGVAVTRRDEVEPDLFGVYSVWVAPAARGRGLGLSLMAALEAFAVAHGGKRLQLMVADAAADARRLYERAGFIADGRSEPSPHTASVTEYGMEKVLP